MYSARLFTLGCVFINLPVDYICVYTLRMCSISNTHRTLDTTTFIFNMAPGNNGSEQTESEGICLLQP